jgi:hypothetical protein
LWLNRELDRAIRELSTHQGNRIIATALFKWSTKSTSYPKYTAALNNPLVPTSSNCQGKPVRYNRVSVAQGRRRHPDHHRGRPQSPRRPHPSSVASFAASACDTRVDYSNKISKFQTEYQAAVDQANRAYVEKAMYSVRSRDANLLDWSNSVNAAVDRYTRQTQETYDNFMTSPCIWW